MDDFALCKNCGEREPDRKQYQWTPPPWAPPWWAPETRTRYVRDQLCSPCRKALAARFPEGMKGGEGQ